VGPTFQHVLEVVPRLRFLRTHRYTANEEQT